MSRLEKGGSSSSLGLTFLITTIKERIQKYVCQNLCGFFGLMMLYTSLGGSITWAAICKCNQSFEITESLNFYKQDAVAMSNLSRNKNQCR